MAAIATREEVRELLDAYTGALDRREYAAWQAMFAADGYYSVVRRVEDGQGSNLVLIGEDMKRLRGRLESGETRDRRRTVHAVSGVRIEPDGQSASAMFALWFDGVSTFAGGYRLVLRREDGVLRIARFEVVLDNVLIPSPIYLPI